MFFGCFLEGFLVVFGFWWSPVGSRVGDPPPGVENGVGRCLKNDFCVDLEGVQLDLYHLKTWKQVVFGRVHATL